MAKIIYFDYWTRGIRHFAAIDAVLRKEGCETRLVHLGSQRGEPAPGPRILDGVNCRDISEYSYSLVAMLRHERPDVVLLLNNQTEDRIVIRACRSLGIRTVYLMHGILPPKEYAGDLESIVDSAFGIWSRLRRIPKYARLFREYLRAALLESPTALLEVELYSYFIRQALSPGGNMAGRWIYRDSAADHALVYSESDRDLLTACWGYSPSAVTVVGNYNLDGMLSLVTGVVQDSASQATPNVVYIENGFSDPKYTIPGWTEDRVAEEVLALAEICGDLGYRLTLKLHPSSDYSVLPLRASAHSSVEVVSNCDLGALIARASMVCGQGSSVLMMALAAKVPIAILSIPPLELHSSVFSDRGFGTLVTSFGAFEELLARRSLDPASVTLPTAERVATFVGPLDGRATVRIADFLLNLAARDVRHARRGDCA